MNNAYISEIAKLSSRWQIELNINCLTTNIPVVQAKTLRNGYNQYSYSVCRPKAYKAGSLPGTNMC